MFRRSILAFLFVLALASARPQNDDGGADAAEKKDNDDDMVEIETKLGKIMGKEVGEDDDTHYEFLGIPYVEPATGKDRFRDPAPIKPWKDAFNATEYGNVCPQLKDFTDREAEEPEVVGDEDCLTLNIFTPRLPARRPRSGRKQAVSSLLPVIIYIHGGYGIVGSGKVDPSAIVADDIILVSLNYRLGALGWLSLASPVAPGNLALKDQLAAMDWVSQNIIAFGGDPAKVTLVGVEFGGVFAHLHQLSPLANGHYRGVVAHGGSALFSMEYISKHRGLTESARYVKRVDCSTNDPNESLNCLQDLEVEDLVRAIQLPDYVNDMERELNDTVGEPKSFDFGPIIDSFSPYQVIPDNPMTLMKTGAQKDIPLIMGVGKSDESFLLKAYAEDIEQIDANWTTIASKFLLDARANEATKLQKLKVDTIRRFYLGTDKISEESEQGLAEMDNDKFFLTPAIKSLTIQSQTQSEPVFLYDMGLNKIAFMNPAEEGEEKEEMSPSDETLVTLLSNFAKHQDPTPYHDDDIPIWKPFTLTEENYLSLSGEKDDDEEKSDSDDEDDSDKPKAKVGLSEPLIYFWDRVYWEDAEKDLRTSTATPLPAPLPAHVGHGPVPLPAPLQPKARRTNAGSNPRRRQRINQQSPAGSTFFQPVAPPQGFFGGN